MLKTVATGINTIGALNYKGTWNADTNTPTLASGVGTKGDYYVVSVAGTTNLDGITDWQISDWAVFNGSVWQKVDNSEVVYVSNVATGTGLTGGPITSTGTISLANTAVTAGSYGDAANVASFTVDQQGRITAASNVTITISASEVTGADITLGNTVLTLGGTTTAVGNLTLQNANINASTSSTATYASAALPLEPEGYITILINGSNKKIPYYGI